MTGCGPPTPAPGPPTSLPTGGGPRPEGVLVTILATSRIDDPAVVDPVDSAAASTDFRMRRSSARWAVPAVPAVLAAVILVVASVLVVGAPTTCTRSRVALPPKRTTSTWQLTATLTGPQFRIASGNPSLVAGATCTTNGLCFLSTGNGLDYGGGGALYVSRDAGHTWAPVALPADTAITTTVSCASSTWCAVGAGRLDATLGTPWPSSQCGPRSSW